MRRYTLVNQQGRKIGYLDESAGLIRSRFGRVLCRKDGNWLVSVASGRTYKIFSDGTVFDLDNVHVADICNYPAVQANCVAANA